MYSIGSWKGLNEQGRGVSNILDAATMSQSPGRTSAQLVCPGRQQHPTTERVGCCKLVAALQVRCLCMPVLPSTRSGMGSGNLLQSLPAGERDTGTTLESKWSAS